MNIRIGFLGRIFWDGLYGILFTFFCFAHLEQKFFVAGVISFYVVSEHKFILVQAYILLQKFGVRGSWK